MMGAFGPPLPVTLMPSAPLRANRTTHSAAREQAEREALPAWCNVIAEQLQAARSNPPTTCLGSVQCAPSESGSAGYRPAAPNWWRPVRKHQSSTRIPPHRSARRKLTVRFPLVARASAAAMLSGRAASHALFSSRGPRLRSASAARNLDETLQVSPIRPAR
jgi:hypothetical protein